MNRHSRVWPRVQAVVVCAAIVPWGTIPTHCEAGGDSEQRNIEKLKFTPLDVSFTIEKKECINDHRAYSVVISGDGRVTYFGEAGVAALGRRKARISPKQVEKIISDALASHFFDLKDNYDGRQFALYEDGVFTLYVERAPDACRTVLMLSLGNRTKTIVNQYNGPEELTRLVERVIEALEIREWIGSD